MPLPPDHALVLRDSAVRSYRSEQPLTQRVIEAIPLDKGDFKIDPVGMTALDLAWHIAGAEHRFLDFVVTGAFDMTATGRPAHLDNSAALARWYAETAAADLDRVATLSADALVTVVDFRGIFKLPAVNFLQIGLNHSIHHRGQLTMFLRPMGSKVPAIYGESYDSKQARAGA
ncbi:MAG: DinB family protein [Acidobacteria bacterium]|nr:DinB family protein [Acidobacteriota bacterium]